MPGNVVVHGTEISKSMHFFVFVEGNSLNIDDLKESHHMVLPPMFLLT